MVKKENTIAKEWNKLKKEVKELHHLNRIRVLEAFLGDIKDKKIREEVIKELEVTRQEMSKDNEIRQQQFRLVIPEEHTEVRKANLEESIEKEFVKEENKQDIVAKQLYRTEMGTDFKGYTVLERLHGDLREIKEGIATGYRPSGQALLQEAESKLEGLRERITTTSQGTQTFNRVKNLLDEIKMYKEGFTTSDEKKDYTTTRKGQQEERY